VNGRLNLSLWELLVGGWELVVGSWAEMGESRDGQIARSLFPIPNSQFPIPKREHERGLSKWVFFDII